MGIEVVRSNIDTEMHKHQVKGGPTLVALVIQLSGDVVMDVTMPILDIFAFAELDKRRIIVSPTINPQVDVLHHF